MNEILISPYSETEWKKLFSVHSPGRAESLDPVYWLDKARSLAFFSSGRVALRAALATLSLSGDDEILIETTSGGPYVSACVTEEIQKLCRWSRKSSSKTKAVVVIHEFGFPFPAEKIRAHRARGFKIIEDCAYAIGSRGAGAPLGREGDFALYSISKSYPVLAGGLLVSRDQVPPTDLAQENEKNLKRAVSVSATFESAWNQRRLDCWHFFRERLAVHELSPYFDLSEGVIPGVYVTRATARLVTPESKIAINAAGIRSTIYYGQGGYYFPVHQFITAEQREYILGQIERFL